MALTVSQRSIIAWVIDYLEKGGAGNGKLDQKTSDELAKVFGTLCGHTCGCPGSFAEDLQDCLGCTLLEIILCLADDVALPPAQRAIVQWVHDYLDNTNGPSGVHFDQKASDELARVFRNACGFSCGCPGSFQDGLRDSPISTLLKVILCVDTATQLEISIEDVVVTPDGEVEVDDDDEAGLFSALLCQFSVLGATTVTNTGLTVLSGDLGLSPGTSVTGFPPGIVLGTQHITDLAAAQAQVELTAAYLDLEGRTGATIVAGNIGGQTLGPGLYKSTSSLAVSSGELTLDGGGDVNAVFIFQIASTLTLTPGRQIILAGGAQAKNVYWQVGSSATLNTTSVFKGSILALTSITVNTGANVEGRLLARNGAVTLESNPVVTEC